MKELSSTNADVARTVENGNQRLNEIVGLIKEISDKTKVINEIAKAMGNIDQSTNEASILSNKVKVILMN